MPDSEAATTPPLTTSNLPIAGSRVRLRDITLEDADLLDAWAADPVARGEFNDFGTEQQLTDRAALAKGPYRNERNGQLIVERLDTGAPVGSVGWRKERMGFGSEAQRLLADYLFGTTPIDRVEASTDVENVAEQRALEKGGFIREGIIRGAQFRKGARHDLVNYARLRTDD